MCLGKRKKSFHNLDTFLQSLKSQSSTQNHCVIATLNCNIEKELFLTLLNELPFVFFDTKHIDNVFQTGRFKVDVTDLELGRRIEHVLTAFGLSTTITTSEVYQKQEKSFKTLQSEVFLCLDKKKKLNTVAIFENNRVSKILKCTQNGWREMIDALDKLLFICGNQHKSLMLESLLSDYETLASSGHHNTLLWTLINEAPNLNKEFTDSCLIRIFEFCKVEKSVENLLEAAMILTNYSCKSIRVFEKYLELLVEFHGTFYSKRLLLCSLMFCNIFHNDQAMELCRLSLPSDTQIFDHVYHLMTLMGYSDYKRTVLRIAMVALIEQNQIEEQLKYYISISLPNLFQKDLHVLQDLFKSKKQDPFEAILEHVFFDEHVIDHFLILIMQLILGNHTKERNEKLIMINELARGQTYHEDLFLFMQKHEIKVDLKEIADCYRVDSQMVYILKESMLEYVTPFHPQNRSSSDRDTVLKFLVDRDMEVLMETMYLYESNYLFLFLQKVCEHNYCLNSVFAILCLFDTEQTKSFINYANDGYFCKMFLKKHNF